MIMKIIWKDATKEKPDQFSRVIAVWKDNTAAYDCEYVYDSYLDDYDTWHITSAGAMIVSGMVTFFVTHWRPISLFDIPKFNDCG